MRVQVCCWCDLDPATCAKLFVSVGPVSLLVWPAHVRAGGTGAQCGHGTVMPGDSPFHPRSLWGSLPAGDCVSEYGPDQVVPACVRVSQTLWSSQVGRVCEAVVICLVVCGMG